MSDRDRRARRYQANQNHEGTGPVSGVGLPETYQEPEPEPTSFREQSDAGYNVVPYRGPRFYDTRTQAALNRAITTQVEARPDLGPQVEDLILTYPVLGRDMLASMVMSGMPLDDLPTAVLDELAQRELEAQAVAEDNPFFSRIKAFARGSFVFMDDLYNASPLLAYPRVGINLYQGRSLEESIDMATVSANAHSIRLERLGYDSDYGQGWLPSQELVPQGSDFFLRVREMILEGDFEGSPEEQVIAAQQAAMREQAEATGINPWALSRAEALSTVLHKTRNGTTEQVSYSPGAAVAIHVTTPGTAAYQMASGTVDGFLRLTAEPIDFVFDNLGDALMVGRPLVQADTFGFALGSRGSKLMREIAEEIGIHIVDEPIVMGVDAAGNPDIAMGATAIRRIEDGVPRAEVNPDAVMRSWERFRARHVGPDGNWIDPTSAYVKPYVDRGWSPDDLTSAIAKAGGPKGQVFLTIEHELVHQRNQMKWYQVQDAADGTQYIDHALVTDNAPAELRDIATKLVDEQLTLADFDAYTAELKAINEQVDAARSAVDQVRSVFDGRTLTKAERRTATLDLKEARRTLNELREQASAQHRVLVDLTNRRNTLDNAAARIAEMDAVETALGRMLNGTWEAKKLVRTYNRKAGLVHWWRPFVKPKSITQWIMGKGGQRTADVLSRIDDIEWIRRNASYLDHDDVLRIANSNDPGEITNILVKAFNEQGIGGYRRPTIGAFRGRRKYVVDNWSRKTSFPGGPVSRSIRNMGAWGRKARASVGEHIFSVTDLDQTLDAIAGFGATIGATKTQINDMQKKAIEHGRTRVGLIDIYETMKRIDVENLQQRGYTAAEATRMWDDWMGYATKNEIYWASNVGSNRKWIWDNGRYKSLSEFDAANMPSEAFMEAQFAKTHITLPDIRRTRRLHSKQRRIWENARRRFNAGAEGSYRPLGYLETSTAMRAGDFAFGLWRDFALMRGGWALRILPEEQLRFGASSYSGLFRNPLDYFISVTNRLDFTLPGDDLTLAEIIKMQESLGTAGLRDLRYPPHVVTDTNWSSASMATHPRLVWGGLTREYIRDNNDRIVRMVAERGREETIEFLRTPEGQQILRDIAGDAQGTSSLALVANDPEMLKYLDVVELRVAQVTGGNGYWKNPETGVWVDVNDVPAHASSNRDVFPNRQTVIDEIESVARSKGLDPAEVLAGTSRYTTGEIRGLLDEVRGFSIDEMEEAGRAAFVTRDGNSDLVEFIATGRLDDIVITPEMPFHEVRAIDSQLEQAYVNRGIEPPKTWPVSDAELTPPVGNVYNDVVDTFFHWANAVPSKYWNRQPFFQQKFGEKIAQVYYGADEEMRAAIDVWRNSHESFEIAFQLGKRKVMRDLGATDFPPPMTRATDVAPTELGLKPEELYQDALQSGAYDRIPLEGDPDGYVTAQFFDALEQLDITEGQDGKARGLYASATRQRADKSRVLFPDITFTASDRKPLEPFIEETTRYGLDTVLNRSHYHTETWDALNDLIHSDDAVTVQALWDRDANMDDVKELFQIGAAQEEWREAFEGLRILTRYHAGEDIDPAVVREAATAAGWREPMRTGGIAWDYTRVGIYGDYVDLHYVPHLPDEVKTHLYSEGDVEQLYTLGGKEGPEGGRYPKLAAIDGFSDAYNSVRRSNGFFETPDALPTLAAGEATAGHYPEAEAYTGFKRLLDDLKTQMPPGDIEQFPSKTYVLHGRPVDFTDEAIEATLNWMRKVAADPEMATMYDAAFELVRPFGNDWQDTFANKNIGAVVANDRDLLVEADYLLRFMSDQPQGATTISHKRMRPMARHRERVMLEGQLGRSFTAAELRELNKMLTHREWAPRAENLVAPVPLDPIARLPVPLMEEIAAHGLMVNSTQAVGDLALLIDTNLQKARTMKEFTPWTGAVVHYDLWDQDPYTHVGKWYGQFAPESSVDYERWNDAVMSKMSEPDADTYWWWVESDTGGPGRFEMTQDFPLWMSSPDFRAFAYEARKFVDDVVEEQWIYDDSLWQFEDYGGGFTIPDSWWEEGGNGYEYAKRLVAADMLFDQIQNGSSWHVVDPYDNTVIDFHAEVDEMVHRLRTEPSNSEWNPKINTNPIEDLILTYEDSEMALLASRKESNPGYAFNDFQPKPEVIESGRITTDFSNMTQADRDAAVKRMWSGADSQRYDTLETGDLPPAAPIADTTKEQLESILKSAKYDSINETKDLFYDLTNKANIADAYKFLFPFGDAWYEVLSRWGKIMWPPTSGGQPLRNIRRTQQFLNAGRETGFIDQNVYGEEVFTYIPSPGLMANNFIPNSTNVELHSTVPVTSLMFIDPTIRGITAPSGSPALQVTTQLLAPVTETIPAFHHALQWLTYGEKENYRPGELQELSDVAQGFMPTVFNRMVATVFNEQHRESIGNVKFQLFEALGLSGNQAYDLTDPQGVARAWDVANTAGSWLSLLRIIDSWTMPGQPQYSVGFAPLEDNDMDLNVILSDTSKLSYDLQQPVIELLRLSAEYRHARDLFGDAEASTYMIERHGVLPAVLQSASSGLVERPVTWGGVEWVNKNKWLNEYMPYTLVATVPPDADDTFSSAAWNNLFGDFLMVDGAENKPIREQRSVSELAQAVQRSVGYDQARYQQKKYDDSLALLRATYADENGNYSHHPEYRVHKLRLDQMHRTNVENIYTEFQVVSGSEQGRIIGERTDVSIDRMLTETVKLGTPGDPAHTKFTKELPQLAAVAEQYARWFTALEAISRRQERQTASGDWWRNAESSDALTVRALLADDVERYYQWLEDPHAKSYAKWLNEYLMDPLLEDYEWRERKFAPAMVSYPSVQHADMVAVERTP